MTKEDNPEFIEIRYKQDSNLIREVVVLEAKKLVDGQIEFKEIKKG